MKCFLCRVCKPEKDGPELGYVADVEHASDGKTPLHGAPLEVARVTEGFLSEPICWLVRKVLRCRY